MSKIGIFWIVDDEVVTFAENVTKVKAVDGRKDSNFAHVDEWIKVQKKFPALKNVEYEEVERGRITYRVKEKEYLLLLSREMMGNETIVSRIIEKFKLPQNKVIVEADFHYTLPQNLTDADFE